MIDSELLYEVATEKYNWAHHEPAPVILLAMLLAGLPGGEELRDAGFEPFANIDWREIDFLARVLTAIETAGDVEKVAKAILDGESSLTDRQEKRNEQ